MPIEFGYLLDIVVLIIIFIMLSEKWKRVSKGRKTLYTMMYIYVAFVLFFTLMPIISSFFNITKHEYVPMNMHLFEDYLIGRKYAKQEIIMNVIMFIPFGIMVPLIRKENFIYVLFKILIFTLTIELLQPLFHVNRIADITDVFTNLLGGIIGYFVYIILRPILKRVFK